MNKKDEIYLNHVSSTLTSEAAGRLQYLGFLVSINIAIYAGLHILDPDDLWSLNGQKLFLALVLVFVNFVFTRMYLREHNLIDIRDEAFCMQLDGDVYRFFKDVLDKKDKMRGITWQTTKILLAGVNAAPIVFLAGLVLMNIPQNFKLQGLSIVELLSGVSLILVGIIVDLLLTVKEHRRANDHNKAKSSDSMLKDQKSA